MKFGQGIALAVAMIASTLTACDSLLGVADALLEPDDAGNRIGVVGRPADGGSVTPVDGATDATLGTSPDAGYDADPAALHLVPPSLDFGTATYDQASLPLKLTLKNGSGEPALAVTLQVDDAGSTDFAPSSDCGAALPPGASCEVSVVFTPSAAGPRHATLSVASASGAATSGMLAGTGAYDYGDFYDQARWETADLTSACNAGTSAFGAAAFDGRRVYFFPGDGSSCTVALSYDPADRSDPNETFQTAGAWSSFDLGGLLGANAPASYTSAVFDGQYVYLVPSNRSQTIVRYDTHQPFPALGSWTQHDLSVNDSALRAFVGATFDGRFIYFAPTYVSSGGSDLALQYDTHADFADANAWVAFDVGTVNPLAKGFAGAVYDGTYVYFVPDGVADTHSGVVARYDPRGSFKSVGSWTTFDTASVNPSATGFAGGVFDGQYLYLIPLFNGAADGVFARYDTDAGAFQDASSWTTFDTAGVDPGMAGYQGGVYDGRDLYAAPIFGIQVNGAVEYGVAQLDTRAPFRSLASWKTIDPGTVVDAGESGFTGAAFDGRYVYFVPQSGVFVRFDAKRPAGMPASWHGSFF
jgi:hypothetical protein